MKDITLVTHLKGLTPTPASAPATGAGGDFAKTLQQTLAEVNRQQHQADRSVEQLHSGQAKNLHEVMISMEQADISMRLLVQMRNKVVEAYQEIMRMQV